MTTNPNKPKKHFARYALPYLAGWLVFMVSFAGGSHESLYDSYFTINPNYKLKRLSNGQVLVTATKDGGQLVNHQFDDIYADLLMATYRKQRVEYMVETFSKKYYLSEEECRRQLKHAINTLSNWDILIRVEKSAKR